MAEQPTLAFTDLETTGLKVSRHHAWEIAIILREPGSDHDDEYLWQVRPNLRYADPEGLQICRFHERFKLPRGAAAAWTGAPGPLSVMSRPVLQAAVSSVLQDAVLIGSNPPFDADFLRKLLRGATPWHYRTVDVAALAAGHQHARLASMRAVGAIPRSEDLVPMPYSSWGLSRAVGVAPPTPDQAHTAMGDARWVRDLYDVITGRTAPQDVATGEAAYR